MNKLSRKSNFRRFLRFEKLIGNSFKKLPRKSNLLNFVRLIISLGNELSLLKRKSNLFSSLKDLIFLCNLTKFILDKSNPTISSFKNCVFGLFRISSILSVRLFFFRNSSKINSFFIILSSLVFSN